MLENSARSDGVARLLQKEFTEPVALLSTRPTDLPLPRRAVRQSFDLLALRARCVVEPRGRRPRRQDLSNVRSRCLRLSSNAIASDGRRNGDRRSPPRLLRRCPYLLQDGRWM